MKRLITPACLVVVCLLGLAEVGARVFFAQDISGRFDYGYNPQAGFNERADGTVESLPEDRFQEDLTSPANSNFALYVKSVTEKKDARNEVPQAAGTSGR